MTDDEIMQAFREPFPASEIGWLPGATTKDKTKALAMPYIDARTVMDRLDEVVGLGGWHATYEMTPDGCWCRLTVKIEGFWITKMDMGDAGDVGGAKSAVSNALKRAAVQFGIGRYLYSVDPVWVDYDDQRKRFKITPNLPAQFLPRKAADGNGEAGPGMSQQAGNPSRADIARTTHAVAICKGKWRDWLKTATTLDRMNECFEPFQAEMIEARQEVWNMIVRHAREHGWEFSKEAGKFVALEEIPA